MEKAGGHRPKEPKDVVLFANVYTVYIYVSKIDRFVSEDHVLRMCDLNVIFRIWSRTRNLEATTLTRRSRNKKAPLQAIQPTKLSHFRRAAT